MLEKLEARLVPPPRKCLSAIIDDIDDEATVKKKKEKALAEHVARHPEDVGRTVEDFNWILWVIVRPAAGRRAALRLYNRQTMAAWPKSSLAVTLRARM